MSAQTQRRPTCPVVTFSGEHRVAVTTWRQRIQAAWFMLRGGAFVIPNGKLTGENPELNRVHLLLDAIEEAFEAAGTGEEERTWEGAREYLRVCLRCARSPEFWEHKS